MSFRLTEEAATYFTKIGNKPIKGVSFLDIDKYHACLMLGLRAGKMKSDAIFTDTFLASGAGYPGPYAANKNYLLGLLVEAEMRRRQLDQSDRDSIERETVKLLDPSSPLGLSDAGIQIINGYCAHGFELLQEKMLPPQGVDEFLVGYAELWSEDPETSSDEGTGS